MDLKTVTPSSVNRIPARGRTIPHTPIGLLGLLRCLVYILSASSGSAGDKCAFTVRQTPASARSIISCLLLLLCRLYDNHATHYIQLTGTNDLQKLASPFRLCSDSWSRHQFSTSKSNYRETLSTWNTLIWGCCFLH